MKYLYNKINSILFIQLFYAFNLKTLIIANSIIFTQYTSKRCIVIYIYIYLDILIII